MNVEPETRESLLGEALITRQKLARAGLLGVVESQISKDSLTAPAAEMVDLVRALRARLSVAEAIISRARHCVREEYARSQILAVLGNPLPPLPTDTL